MYSVPPLDWLGSTHLATLSYFIQPVGSLDAVDQRSNSHYFTRDPA